MKRNLNSCSARRIVALALAAFSVLPLWPTAAQSRHISHAKGPTKICQNKRTMEKITTFSYHQSGGFAAINRNYSVNLADMSKDEREKLEGLIEKSGLLSMKKQEKTTPGAADMFFYEFTVGDHKATFDDGSLPESFKPLRDYAKDKAANAKKLPNPGAM